MIVAIFFSIAGFKKGREVAAKRNIALFNVEYTQEEIKKDLDLFSSIEIDLSVSDLIINDTQETQNELSYNLNANVGHITINGQSSSALSNSLKIENDTAKSHLQISTNVGDIDISFNN